MHDDRIAFGNLLEHVARAPLGIHEVFGDDLKPIDLWLLLENVAKVGGSQTDAQTQIRVSQTW